MYGWESLSEFIFSEFFVEKSKLKYRYCEIKKSGSNDIIIHLLYVMKICSFFSLCIKKYQIMKIIVKL